MISCQESVEWSPHGREVVDRHPYTQAERGGDEVSFDYVNIIVPVPSRPLSFLPYINV